MRDMSAAFRRAIFEGRADFTNTLVFTFADNSTLTLTNENLAMDGAKMEDAVSDNGVFQVGAVIVNAATFTLINMEGNLDGYEFGGAQVVWYVGMDGLDDETDATPNDGAARMGTFYVDETEYDGHMITLRCLDNAGKLDKQFLWPINSEQPIEDLIGLACLTYGGVDLDPATWQNLPHGSYVVKPPDDVVASQTQTCRQTISWLLQLIGCFARCDAYGQLAFHRFADVLGPQSGGLYGGYFDETTEPKYQSGDDADGGSFNPWNTGDVYDGGSFTPSIYGQGVNLIQSCFSQKLSMKDVEITGVKVIYKTGDGGSSAAVAEASTGTTGYVISVEDNPLINTLLNASYSRNTIQDILGFIGESVIGLKFRAGEIVHPSDPAIEAGDVGFYWDIHQNQHTVLISSTEFSGGVTQRTVSSAASAEKNASTRYSNSTQNYVSTMAAVALAVYPVGSIYMSVNSTNPGTLFGGTWEQLQNRFLLGAGTSYNAGATGGEATHTLTTSEMPAHTHKSGNNAGHYAFGGGSTATGPASGSGYATSLASIDSGSAGSGGAHNNMPPYLVVYMWKRTA